MNAQELITRLQKNKDVDLIDKQSFTRYRAVENGEIRVWHNGNFVCDSPAEHIKGVLEGKIQKGETDFKFV